jgi:limonene 1,2-monooxygenase
MGPMHVAESESAAIEQCRYGLRWQYEYLSHITPSAIAVPETTEGLVDVLNSSGRASIGTPDMAGAQIQRLIDRSGGFGTYLFQGVDFASWQDTLRSYELFAEEVIPRFDGTLTPVLSSYEHVLSNSDSNRSATAAARVAASEQWKREREAAG